MPISEYYKGKGQRVMSSMKKRYGPKKGKEVFYATAHVKGMFPGHKGASLAGLKKAAKG